MEPTHPPLVVIGAGNMGRAIVVGGLLAGVLNPERVVVAEPNAQSRLELVRQCGEAATTPIATHASATEAMRWLREAEAKWGVGQVLLCVKPQSLKAATAEIQGEFVGVSRVVVTILAGTPSSKVRGLLGPNARVVRAMPNLAARLRLGATATCRGDGAKSGDDDLARRLFKGVGPLVVEIEERLMDAFTAVAGSGPAYVFYLTEAMIVAAREIGFDDATARSVVRQTIVGASALLEESSDDPGVLRAAVTSKGGTTAAATAVLERAGARRTWIDAIRAARDRGEELARV